MVEFGSLQVTCLKEDETPGFAFREFKLVHSQVCPHIFNFYLDF